MKEYESNRMVAAELKTRMSRSVPAYSAYSDLEQLRSLHKYNELKKPGTSIAHLKVHPISSDPSH